MRPIERIILALSKQRIEDQIRQDNYDWEKLDQHSYEIISRWMLAVLLSLSRSSLVPLPELIIVHSKCFFKPSAIEHVEEYIVRVNISAVVKIATTGSPVAALILFSAEKVIVGPEVILSTFLLVG